MKTLTTCLLAAWLGACSQANAQSIITTVAGSGRILTGVGGPAVGIPLAGPKGLTLDSEGNLYIADNQQNIVFKVSPGGIATIFAGNGTRGYSGDGGPAIAAALTEPGAVAADASGNVYIADFHNERIRKVDVHGIITTFAGGGIYSETDEIPAIASTIFEPASLALDAAGALYLTEEGKCSIRKVTPDGIIHHVAGGSACEFSGDGGPASSAQLHFPEGITFDSKGNLYFADSGNNRIREISAGGIISTVVGNGTAGDSGDGGPATSASLALPGWVVIDAGADILIADTYDNCVRKVTPDGIITTVAGNRAFPPTFSGDGGPAIAASLYQPYGMALDPAGNLYVSDQNNRRVRRVSASGIINTIAGNGVSNFAGDSGPGAQASLDFPTDVKVDSAGNLYIADSMNHRVRRVTPTGTITTIAGTGQPGFSGDGGSATSAQLNAPASVAIDGSGNVYISDTQNSRIRRVAPDGTISTWAGNGMGGYSGDGGPAVSASLAPWGISTDGNGDLYIADHLNFRVRKITPAGIITTVAGNGDAGFSGDGGPATQAMLNGPDDVAVDQMGDIFISDAYNDKVRKVTPDGIITTVADGSASGGAPIPTGVTLANIEGVAADGGQVVLDTVTGVAADNQGNLYFTAGWYVYRVNSAGIITLLVGAGRVGYQEGFDGDGGPSVAAHLVRDTSRPDLLQMGMGVDAAGNLYFADTGNDRIRKITNAAANAQLAITTPNNYWLYPPTGADQPNIFLYGAASQQVNVLNVGTGAMSWTATVSTLSGGDWLTVSSSSGIAPSTITVSADIGGLAPGFYLGTILLSSPVASNGSRYVTISLTVPIPFLSQNANSGTIVVTEPPGVGWWTSSDESWFTFPSGSTGIGSGILAWSAAANADGSPPYRSATVTVGPAIIVSQGVGLVSQTITFAPLGDVIPGAAPFAISATASSGLSVAFASTTTSVCTVSGSTVTIVGSGTCAITASQAGNSSYAPAAPITLTFNIEGGPVGTPPVIQAGGVVPLYSSINTIQPGSWVSIYGSNLATSTTVWNGDFPTSLGGTSVTINGKAGYLWFVGPGQINLQAPDDTTSGPVSVVVTTPGGSSSSTVTLAPVGPSFDLLDSKHVTGIILRSGTGAYGGGAYDIIGPTGTSLGYPTVAARAGDTVELFGVGFGATNPPVAAGTAFSEAAPTTSPVYLVINNLSVVPSFAGLSGAGLYQINVTIPSGLGTGDIPLVATIGGVETPAGVVISLQ